VDTKGRGRLAVVLMMGDSLECVAETGKAVGSADNCCNFQMMVPTEGLKQGDFFESSDAQKDIRLDQLLCREAGIGSLIAAPIHRFDEFDGLIELRWRRANAFQESDTRATRLMAGLISGLRERNARSEERKRLQLSASDIQPVSSKDDDSSGDQLTDFRSAAASQSESELRILPVETVESIPPTAEPAEVNAIALPSECRVCGRRFGADEAFCGQCGMPRVAGAPSEELQSKWASLWYMQQAQETQQKELPALSAKPPLDVHPPIPQKAQEGAVSQKAAPPITSDPGVRIWHVPESDTRRDNAITPAQPQQFEPLRSEERSFFIEPDVGSSTERLGPTKNPLRAVASATQASEADASSDLLQSTWQSVWARMHRRHATWALSAVGLLLVFLMLAVWPSSTNSQLTWFQSLLVKVGLADVPARAPALSDQCPESPPHHLLTTRSWPVSRHVRSGRTDRFQTRDFSMVPSSAARAMASPAIAAVSKRNVSGAIRTGKNPAPVSSVRSSGSTPPSGPTAIVSGAVTDTFGSGSPSGSSNHRAPAGADARARSGVASG